MVQQYCVDCNAILTGLDTKQSDGWITAGLFICKCPLSGSTSSVCKFENGELFQRQPQTLFCRKGTLQFPHRKLEFGLKA